MMIISLKYHYFLCRFVAQRRDSQEQTLCSWDSKIRIESGLLCWIIILITSQIVEPSQVILLARRCNYVAIYDVIHILNQIQPEQSFWTHKFHFKILLLLRRTFRLKRPMKTQLPYRNIINIQILYIDTITSGDQHQRSLKCIASLLRSTLFP